VALLGIAESRIPFEHLSDSIPDLAKRIAFVTQGSRLLKLLLGDAPFLLVIEFGKRLPQLPKEGMVVPLRRRRWFVRCLGDYLLVWL
jgi:hypothetical protein